MTVFANIQKGRYMDSLETLFAASLLNEQEGVSLGFVGMATPAFQKELEQAGMLTEEIRQCTGSDTVVAAQCRDQAAFDAALAALNSHSTADAPRQTEESFVSTRAAVEKHPEANLCSIAVPGEYALSEVRKALNLGLHCVVFSNNVPTSSVVPVRYAILSHRF